MLLFTALVPVSVLCALCVAYVMTLCPVPCVWLPSLRSCWCRSIFGIRLLMVGDIVLRRMNCTPCLVPVCCSCNGAAMAQRGRICACLSACVCLGPRRASPMDLEVTGECLDVLWGLWGFWGPFFRLFRARGAEEGTRVLAGFMGALYGKTEGFESNSGVQNSGRSSFGPLSRFSLPKTWGPPGEAVTQVAGRDARGGAWVDARVQTCTPAPPASPLNALPPPSGGGVARPFGV